MRGGQVEMITVIHKTHSEIRFNLSQKPSGYLGHMEKTVRVVTSIKRLDMGQLLLMLPALTIH